MLQRNLIYTGITRAKKILVLVGTKKVLHYAIRNVTVQKRNTMLKERICKVFKSGLSEGQEQMSFSSRHDDYGESESTFLKVAEKPTSYGRE